MIIRVIFSPQAEKQFKKVPKIVQISLARKVRQFSSGEIVAGVKALSDYKNFYRVRVGDYRMVYRKRTGEFYIVCLGHRKEIYKLLKRLFG